MSLSPVLVQELKDSAIAPSVSAAAVAELPDVEFDPITREAVATPIDDILGRKYTRFGFQVKATRTALGFQNEDGSFWQLKVFGESVRGRSGKYLAPTNIGDRPYLPTIPRALVLDLADQYGIEPPAEHESFWKWFKEYKQIPLLLTEGGKKSLSAISQGYLALSLFGCLCGVNKDGTVKESLRPYVEGRKVFIAFDEDVKAKAAKAVRKGNARLARAITRAGGSALVAHWDKDLGKGIDDLIAFSPDEFKKAIANAVILDVSDLRRRRDLGAFVDHRIHSRYFPEFIPLPNDANVILAKGAKGTGKTTWLCSLVEENIRNGIPTYLLTHRVQLAKALCAIFGLDHIDTLKDSLTGEIFGYGLCIDSLHPEGKSKFNPDNMEGATIIIDEADQAFWHGLSSNTCQGKRSRILETLTLSIQTALATGGRVIATSADVRPVDLKYIKGLAGDVPVKTFIVENTFVPIKGDMTAINRPEDVIGIATEYVQSGLVPIIHLSAQKERSRFSTINVESYLNKRFPDKKFLRIDAETVADPSHPAFNCIENLDEIIPNYDGIICSPAVETGVSINSPHIDGVFAIASGVQTVDGACQSIERVRSNVPRFVYFAEKAKSVFYVGNGATYAKELLRSESRKFQLNLGSLAAADLLFDNQLHTQIWAEMAAEHNLGFRNYRAIAFDKLRSEGYQINEVGETTAGDAFKAVSKEIRDANYLDYCRAVERQENPSDSLYLSLQGKLKRTKDELIGLRKGTLCRRYLTEDVPIDLVKDDDEGLFQKLQNQYLLFGGAEFLEQHHKARLESLTFDGKGAIVPDINKVSLKARIDCLRILLFKLGKYTSEKFTGEALRPWLDEILPTRRDIKDCLGCWINPKDSPISAAQRILAMGGMKFPKVGRSGNVRAYGMPVFDFEKYRDILNRWHAKETGNATPPINLDSNEGVALVSSEILETPELPQGITQGVAAEIENALRKLYEGTKEPINELVAKFSHSIIQDVARFFDKTRGWHYEKLFIDEWVFG